MWYDNYLFRNVALTMWAKEVNLAQSRRKGHAAANRRMQCRYEGFHLLTSLVIQRDELASLVRQVQSRAKL